MPSLRRDLRSELERTVVKARDIAEAAATAALQALAVDQPKPFPHMDADAKALRNRLRERGRAAGDVRNDFTTTQTIEHLAQLVAYEHWHRMLFARFLAENGLLLEPEHQVALSLADVEELAREEGADLWQLAGSYAQRMLPEVFRNDDPALEVTLAREDRVKLEKLLADLDPATFTATDALGWTYQFWQTKRKGEVNASGVKIGADEISPVTQLFTEDYMVDFLLDNTLGAWWAGNRMTNERMTNDEWSGWASEDEARAAVALPGCPWKYLRFINHPSNTSDDELRHSSFVIRHFRPAAGTFDGWPKSAAELKCLDPCMGSGHFIVAMFERLVALRIAEENLDEKSAVIAVIRDNLLGLEIDPRCTQIAVFNLALAAWRRLSAVPAQAGVGHCKLPAMNLACSGLAPNTREADWLAMAGDNDKLRRGMERLYRLFQNAPVLGSLINPRAGGGDLLEAAFHELQPLLEKALAQETKDDTAQDLSSEALAKEEMAVTARGLAKAAEILAGQFTLVATNVPYLGAKKQDDVLKDYCERAHPQAKADLATCFVERCIELCAEGGSTSLVTPQNWLFLGTYEALREHVLKTSNWRLVARLGPKGFQTPMWDFNTVLLTFTRRQPTASDFFAGIDVAECTTPSDKSLALAEESLQTANQLQQLKNPDCRVILHAGSDLPLLEVFATNHQGLSTGDNPRFRRFHWEVATFGKVWEAEQSTVEATQPYGGRSGILQWEQGHGELYRFGRENVESLHNVDRRGEEAWDRLGVAVAQIGKLPATLFGGQKFDTNAAVLLPRKPELLPALWAYCSSAEFREAVRRVDQKLNVTNATLVKVPFDPAHWQQVAAEKYPDGLPKPFSSDPTQWLFDGAVARPSRSGSDLDPERDALVTLHVAVARLLGYRWPRQTGSEFPDCPALGPDGLEPFCDQDGIVCLTPLRGEAKAAERLRKLLDAAYGSVGVPPTSRTVGVSPTATEECGQDAHAPWNERQLLAAAGSTSTNLEDWLRDEFFEQHCKLFHHRPFIWHIWDGRPDGFHALVNYHQLAAPAGAGHKLLETLTYAYLGDWIRRQKGDAANGVPGAESRLEAAATLQQELKNILQGEPPYDLFIRWKPLHQQAIGWHPDINDGVRLNIRPFLYAKDVKKKDTGILRWKPNVKWTKDRGTEPQRPKTDYPWFWTWDEKTQDFQGSHKFDGCRWNDLHYANEAKQAARAAHEKKGTEA